MWACKRVSCYLIGLDSFTLLTDHKPLAPLFKQSSTDHAPVRCQWLLMRMLRFNATAGYVPGKELVVTDCLSCNLLAITDTSDIVEEVELYVESL